MELKVVRLSDDGNTTIGAFYINGKFKCFTVEDQKQLGEKIMNETRVPEGMYNVGLRREGGFHNRYKTKYEDIHRGMLCIYNDSDWKVTTSTHCFQYILIHTGNTNAHTGGCLLLNYGVDGNNFIGSSSVKAYRDIYPEIANAIYNGEACTIEYIDIEK